MPTGISYDRYCVCRSYARLMPATHKAPMMSSAPATASIFTWLPTAWRTNPPTTAAMICGKQMVQLNKPRYVPIFGLPWRALVKKMNGKASIAAQPQPMSRNYRNKYPPQTELQRRLQGLSAKLKHSPYQFPQGLSFRRHRPINQAAFPSMQSA